MQPPVVYTLQEKGRLLAHLTISVSRPIDLVERLVATGPACGSGSIRSLAWDLGSVCQHGIDGKRVRRANSRHLILEVRRHDKSPRGAGQTLQTSDSFPVDYLGT